MRKIGDIRMSYELVEITRGNKPIGKCFHFGSTTTSDFYIKSNTDKYISPYWWRDFLKKFNEAITTEYFGFTKEQREFQEKFGFFDWEKNREK